MPNRKFPQVQRLFILLDGLYHGKQPPGKRDILQLHEFLHGFMFRQTFQHMGRKSTADRRRLLRKALFQQLSVDRRQILLRHPAHKSISRLQIFRPQLYLGDDMPFAPSLPADPYQLLFLQTFHEKVDPLIFRRAFVEVSRQRLFRKTELDMDLPSVLSCGKQAGLISVQQPVQDHLVILHHCNTSPRSSPFHPSSPKASPPQRG